MKLYEYKAKALTILLNYEPKNQRERELKNTLITSIVNLRKTTMPRLLMDLYLIMSFEKNVSNEFKTAVKKLVQVIEWLR